jgi:predicted enzyme related to lactoylglutathione lyase
MAAPRGKFIWYDVMTSDTKAATAFYSDVIGWQAQEHPMPDNGSYTVFSKDEQMVAGLMAHPKELCAEGAKPCWSGYIASDDVDADAARVLTEGGVIRRAPQDIPNVGRFAVAADPGGAVFLLFKPNTTQTPKPVAPMTPGHIGDRPARDPQGAAFAMVSAQK